MNRVLLADASPHAQRIGESILRDEGFEVVAVTDGETAILRLADVDPDVIIADEALPKRSGIELCRWVKQHPKHKMTRVIVTAGALADFSEELARNAGADATLRKPFEATSLIQTVRPLAEAAARDRAALEPERDPIDPDRIRAAVTLALDRAMPALINELTEKVIASLKS